MFVSRLEATLDANRCRLVVSDRGGSVRFGTGRVRSQPEIQVRLGRNPDRDRGASTPPPTPTPPAATPVIVVIAVNVTPLI